MARERRSEAIWIESKGYWQVKVQSGGVRKAFTSSTKGRKGKHEAEWKADDWLAAGTREMKLKDAWKAFLEWHKRQNGTQNYQKHETAGRLYILPAIGDRRLSAISPAVWQRAIDAGADKGLSRRSLVNLRGSITAFLRHARRERWECEQLLPDDLRIPSGAAPEKPKKALPRDAIQTLFSDPTFMHHNRRVVCQYAYAWRLLVATGLRRGELAGLRVEDIGEECIHIRRSINSLQEITSGKNDNARRDIALTAGMREILADQRAMLAEKGIESPWVFPDEYGEQPNPARIYTQWRAYAEQHGISGTVHEMRHTFISMCKADMPIELLKLVVGHSVSMDTIGIYGHEIDGDKARAAAIMDTVLTRTLGGKVGGKNE